jgi:competence protein ComEA
MVRHGGPPDDDEQPAALARLAAMRLPGEAQGWVPAPADPVEPLAEADPVARQAVAAEPTIAPPLPPGPPSLGSLARAWAIDRSPPWARGMVAGIRGRQLAMVAAVVVALAVGGLLVVHRASGSTGAAPYANDPAGAVIASPESSSPLSTDPVGTTAPVDGVDGGSIVVDVGGRVRRPGLVTLPAGARVADALAAAGGPLRRREVATLDLAARVTDGQLLLIGVKTPPPDAGTAAGTDDAATGGTPVPVDLDAATIDELETLPGVGPVTAQKIIDWRVAHGGFTAVSQLQQVSGIGPTRYAELSPLVMP